MTRQERFEKIEKYHKEAIEILEKIEKEAEWQLKVLRDLMEPVLAAIYSRAEFTFEDWIDEPHFNVTIHRLVADITVLKNKNYIKYLITINDLISLAIEDVKECVPEELRRLEQLEHELAKVGGSSHNINPVTEALSDLNSFNSIVIDFQENGEAVWDSEVIM